MKKGVLSVILCITHMKNCLIVQDHVGNLCFQCSVPILSPKALEYLFRLDIEIQKSLKVKLINVQNVKQFVMTEKVMHVYSCGSICSNMYSLVLTNK